MAQRALKGMIPAENPYTIHIGSEILESNGSSSMATVCAGTLALMDAGIQMIRPVSGIAMGLISDEKTGKFAVLSDILGDEDNLGNMDFKVKGLSYGISTQALEKSKGGRMHILGTILKTIDTPRVELKAHAPRIEILKVAKDCIGGIIGPGGKIIQKLQLDTDTTITIEEIGGFGKVEILGTNKEGMDAAIAKINEIAFMPTVGEEYDGRVKNIQAYGAFVEIAAGKDGLLHISEIDWKRINNVEDVLKVDDPVRVKIIDVDAKTGKMKFSRKVLSPKPETKSE